MTALGQMDSFSEPNTSCSLVLTSWAYFLSNFV